MYALSDKYADIKNTIENDKEDYQKLEGAYASTIESVWRAMDSFMSKFNFYEFFKTNY